MTTSFKNEPFDLLVDTSGLVCPEPVMMLHSAVRQIALGQVVKVIATDPSTARDIPKFCGFLGHELIAHECIQVHNSGDESGDTSGQNLVHEPGHAPGHDPGHSPGQGEDSYLYFIRRG
jgi:tRNA 2-thiouridine synthesizing protein A